MRKLFLLSALLIFACSEGDDLPVDADPCSNDSSQIDTDGDGVCDNLDAFPLNGIEWADSDGDGVGDHSDACQNTPDGQTVDCTGC